MVSFDFTVNSSFLSYPSHPITVPKTQVDYHRLERENLGREIAIIEPNGMRMAGRLYRSIAGYGEYYQIRIQPDVPDPLYALQIGARLRVEMIRAATGGEVRLHMLSRLTSA
jgi:hypothetical protein